MKNENMKNYLFIRESNRAREKVQRYCLFTNGEGKLKKKF